MHLSVLNHCRIMFIVVKPYSYKPAKNIRKIIGNFLAIIH